MLFSRLVGWSLGVSLGWFALGIPEAPAQEVPQAQGEVVVPQDEFSRGVPAKSRNQADDVVGPGGAIGPSPQTGPKRRAAPPTAAAPAAAPRRAAQEEFGLEAPARRLNEPEYLLPTGWQLTLGHTFGAMSRVQFGGANWLNDDWGLGVDAGFDYSRRRFNRTTQGVAQPVTRLRYDVVPEVVVMRTLYHATTKRLLVSLAGGPILRKDEGKSLGTGFTVHAGPGIDWPLSKQLSFHFEQWVTFLSDPDPAVGQQIEFQPQLSMIWWFQ